MVWSRLMHELWIHTIRLVRWEIEKESDMVKQRHGKVARQQGDMY
jgi:hypothetical protein